MDRPRDPMDDPLLVTGKGKSQYRASDRDRGQTGTIYGEKLLVKVVFGGWRVAGVGPFVGATA
jgi:hypothetical protein